MDDRFVNRLFAEATSGLPSSDESPSGGFAYLRRIARPCVYLLGHRSRGFSETLAGIIDEDGNGRVDIVLDLSKMPSTCVLPEVGCFSLTFDFGDDSCDIPFSVTYTDVEPSLAVEGTTTDRTRIALAPVAGMSLPWAWPSSTEYDPDFPDELSALDLCWMASELHSCFLSQARKVDRLISLGGHPFGDDDCSHWSDYGCILIAEVWLDQFAPRFRSGAKLRYFVDRQSLPLQHCDDVWCAS